MNQHPLDQIDAYLAGGLTADERAEFEAHLAQCPDCADALREATQMDASVNQLFAWVQPKGDFEDRLVHRLRQGKRRRAFIHPIVQKAAGGIAAALLLTTVGYIGNKTMNDRPWRIAAKFAIDHGAKTAGLSAAEGPAREPSMVRGDWHYYPPEQYGFGESEQTENTDSFRRGLTQQKGRVDQITDSLALQDENAVTRARSDVSDKKGFGGSSGGGMAWGLPQELKQSAELGYNSYYSLSTDQSKTVGKPELKGGLAAAPAVSFGRGGMDAAKNGTLEWKDLLIKPVNSEGEVQGVNRSLADAGAVASTAAPTPSKQEPAAPGRGDAAPRPNDAANQTIDAGRKVIRSGDMEFEVDNFDSAVGRVQKIVGEEGGFVSTTESDKLPNGKVRGRIVLRCPPDRLDTLVLKLRGIGDLHTQKIGAQDITKQYTDLASGLRAARAMEDRLLEIIKTGKGQVKDLLEAEKQLGVWREKIEQLEGEIRYYNNLVALSTLTITLSERDIQTPAYASEHENVTMALETEKVEDAYQKARDAVDQAKGRITSSELKQFDAGQYRAVLSAQLPPDQAEAFIARIRQLGGRLAHFERQRTQSTTNGNATRTDLTRVKREDVVISLTIYNLANIAPRRTSTLVVVTPNVEQAYQSVIDQVNAAGGRVVTSAIARPSAEQTDGSINFNVPTDKADLLLSAIRGLGEVVKSDTAESPDAQNVTDSKRGFALTLASLSAFGARENQQLQLAAENVPEAFSAILAVAGDKGGRVLNSQLNEQDPQNVTGTLDFWAPREALPTIEQALGKSAEVVSRLVTRSSDTQNTVDSKVMFKVTVSSSSKLPARETIRTTLAAENVPDTFNAIRAALPATARLMVFDLQQQDPQNVTGKLTFDLPANNDMKLSALLSKQTASLSRQVARIPEGQIAVDKVRYEITLIGADRQPPRQFIRQGVQVTDVDQSTEDFLNNALNAGGRQVDNPTRSEDGNGHVSSTAIVELPLDHALALLSHLDQMGTRRGKDVHLDTTAPLTPLARSRIEVTFSNSAASLGGQESMADYLRHGLLTSLAGLGYSLMWLVIGICLVAPWAIVVSLAWKFIARRRRNRLPKPAAVS